MRARVGTASTVLAFLVFFMAFAAWREWPWWEYAFLSDGSPVAWLSGALLVANAAILLTLGVTGRLPGRIAYPLSAALAYLAIDEQFQFHERLKEAIGPGTVANVPILMVAAGGAAALVVLARAIPSPAARMLLCTAVAVGVFAVWVDLGSPPVVVGRLEEAFEVLSEGLFLCGLLEAGRPQVQSDS